MKIFFIIIFAFNLSPLFSQDRSLEALILKIKPTGKNAIQSYQNILRKYDSTEIFNSSVCARACEKLGDIYKSRKEYSKAIAYYDSLNIKYIDRLEFCGNAVYGLMVRQRLKVAQCFVELKDTVRALGELAPYIFQYENDYYCTGEAADFYVKTIKAVYSQEEIRAMIDSSLNAMSYRYNYQDIFNNKGEPAFSITGVIYLFNVHVDIVRYYSTIESEKNVADSIRKEFFVGSLKETKIFKRIYD